YIYLIQRYLFGLDQTSSPVTAKGETAWFAFYGLAAFIYRLFIMVVIALFLIEQYFFIGVALAVWAILNQLLMPLIRGLRFLTSAPALEEQRTRAGLVTSGLVGGVVLILLFLPVSLTTQVNGVVWVSDQAQLFVETNGFVEEIMVQPGSPVTVGVPILRMRDPTLDTRIEVLEAKRRGLELRSAAERLKARVQSNITMEELAAVKSELKLLKQHSSALIVRAKTAGKVILPGEKNLNGLYLKRGDLIGYVASPEHLIVRAVIPQENIGLVQKQVSDVQVRFAERVGQVIDTHILRETPAANRKLPSAALGVTGGGDITLSMGDDTGRTAAEKFFQLDMALPAGLNLVGLGERAYIRINHGAEPLAKQWSRSIRQLFLSRLSL
ncbi:MAG: peptidase M50, partial [Aestuariibacter sp.]|nr:peptidase M50 [Aestuariibacter sp.]